MKNTPKLRFKGFEGEWEEKVFTDVASRLSQTEKAGDLPGVEFEDIVSGHGILNKDLDEKQCNKVGKLFSAGDVLFGKLRPYLKNILLPDFKGVAIGDFWVLHPEGIESKLLYEIVNSDKFMEVANVSSGSKMPRADWNFVSNAIVAVPSDKSEQRKLSSYFTHLDTLIEASRQKVEKLKQVKAASLQSFFPAHGQRVPKIRFKGCEGEWKKVELGDVLLINSGRDYKHLKEGNIPVFGTGGYMLSVNKSLSSVDAIGIGRKGTIDRPQYLKAPFWTVDTLFYLTAKRKDNLRFLFALAQNIDWKRYDESTGVPSLSKSNIETITFQIPSLPEQRLIAQYFTHLDSLLSLERQRYAKLQQVKRASLSQMLV